MFRRHLAFSLFVASPLLAAETKPTAANYELRGFFGAGANTDTSLRNTSTGKSQWYHLGDRLGGILVEKADAKTGTATIVVNGERRTLRIAGESVTESENEKHVRILHHYKILKDYFAEWDQEMTHRRKTTLEQAGADLFKSHPEYFTEEGSRTPEAKAAILRIEKESIKAGMTVGDKYEPQIPLPENLDEVLKSVYGDISINLNPSISDETAKAPGSYSQIVTLYGHPMKSTTTDNGRIDEARVKETFNLLHKLYMPAHFSDLQNAIDRETKK